MIDLIRFYSLNISCRRAISALYVSSHVRQGERPGRSCHDYLGTYSGRHDGLRCTPLGLLLEFNTDWSTPWNRSFRSHILGFAMYGNIRKVGKVSCLYSAPLYPRILPGTASRSHYAAGRRSPFSHCSEHDQVHDIRPRMSSYRACFQSRVERLTTSITVLIHSVVLEHLIITTSPDTSSQLKVMYLPPPMVSDTGSLTKISTAKQG